MDAGARYTIIQKYNSLEFPQENKRQKVDRKSCNQSVQAC